MSVYFHSPPPPKTPIELPMNHWPDAAARVRRELLGRVADNPRIHLVLEKPPPRARLHLVSCLFSTISTDAATLATVTSTYRTLLCISTVQTDSSCFCPESHLQLMHDLAESLGLRTHRNERVANWHEAKGTSGFTNRSGDFRKPPRKSAQTFGAGQRHARFAERVFCGRNPYRR